MKTLKFALGLSMVLLFFNCSMLQKAPERPQTTTSTSNEDLTIEEDNDWDTEEDVVIEEPAPYYGVQFVDSDLLRPLLERAKKEDKLVFVDFYATWCAPCKVMDERVFSDEKIGSFMNENFISYKVDVDESHLSVLYDIKSLPTLLFLDWEGEVLVRKDGSAFHSELRSLGEKALQLTGASAGGR